AAAALLASLLLCTNLFAQGGNGALTGTVEDPTGALIPGVKVTAMNTGTGVETAALTNESGAYNILSLLPGVYRLTAELSGFRSAAFNNIELATNETKRINFTLTVAGVTQAVDVVIDATNLIAASAATIGDVLPEQRV